jgi:hypothetical protein
MSNLSYLTSKMSDYLTTNPEITFNKEVYKQYTDIGVIRKIYNVSSTDGVTYECNTFCGPETKNSFTNNIKLFLEHPNSLSINDILHVEITIESPSTRLVLHRYSGKTLYVMSLMYPDMFKNNSIELPIVKYMFIDYIIQYGYTLNVKIKLNKFVDQLCFLATYIKMNTHIELETLRTAPIHRLLKHIIDETFEIKQGENYITLSPCTMQCGAIIFTFPHFLENVKCILTINDTDYPIDKYYSNIQYHQLNDCRNVMIFDSFENLKEINNYQPTGNILIKNKMTLKFDSNLTGHFIVGYILYDIIMYNHQTNNISFADMPNEIKQSVQKIKYIKISKDCIF